MKEKTLLLLFWSLFFTSSTFAQTVYVEFDVNCIDKYEYIYNGNQSKVSIDYHVRLNDQEKIILNAGSEKTIRFTAKPDGVRNCRDSRLNEELVFQINNGDKQIYLIGRDQNGHFGIEISSAAFFYHTKEEIGYSTGNYVFAYMFDDPISRNSISTNDSAAEVFFQGNQSYSCPKEFLFGLREKQTNNYIELVMVPKIGIISRKAEIEPPYYTEGKLELNKINDMPAKTYMAAICEGKTAQYLANNNPNKKTYPNNTTTVVTNNNNRPTSYSNDNGTQLDNTAKYTYENGKPLMRIGGIPYEPPVGSSPEANPRYEVYKDADRGLYYEWDSGKLAHGWYGGIEYRQGYMVGQEPKKNLNKPVYVDTRPKVEVKVVPKPTPPQNTWRPQVDNRPVVVAKPRCTDYALPGEHVVQHDETLYSIARNTGVSVTNLRRWNGIKDADLIYPCSKIVIDPSVLRAQPGTDETFASRGVAPHDYHVVKKNETIYSLSKKYNMPQSKFRSINGLGASDLIHPGQTLKIAECNCPTPKTYSYYGEPSAPQNYDYVAPNNNEFVNKGQQPVSYSTQSRKVHIVQDNETLFSIAKRYGLSVNRLRFLNSFDEYEVIIPYQRI